MAIEYSGPQLTATEQTSMQVTRKMLQTVNAVEANLLQVRRMIKGQRAAVAAEIGSENAALLLSVYQSLVDAVEAAKGVSVEAMPN